MEEVSESLLTFLNPVYFWDVNLTELDIEQDADYIIRRVFELGDIDEIGLVHGWYGTERCVDALLNAEYLREPAIVQGMAFLGISDRVLFKASSKPQHHAI